MSKACYPQPVKARIAGPHNPEGAAICDPLTCKEEGHYGKG